MRRSVGQANDGITTRLITAKTVSPCKERGSGHWVSIVMMTGGEESKTYRVRDKSAPFQKRPSMGALEPRFL
jgi:hypothetical protein